MIKLTSLPWENKQLKAGLRLFVVNAIFLFFFCCPLFAQESISEWMCEIAEAHYSLGEYDSALQEFQNALLVDPNNAKARNYVAKLSARGQEAAAAVTSRKSASLVRPASSVQKKKAIPQELFREQPAQDDNFSPSPARAGDAPVKVVSSAKPQPQSQKAVTQKKKAEITKDKPRVYLPKSAGENKKYASSPSSARAGDAPVKVVSSAKPQPQPQKAVTQEERARLIKGALKKFSLAQGEDKVGAEEPVLPAGEIGRQEDIPGEGPTAEAAGKDEEGGNSFLKVSGEVRLGLGVTSDDVIWKDANADRIGVPREKNWRYLWGGMRHNTYDPKIYDRLNLVMETQLDSPFNVLMDFTLDPWTFIGKNHVTLDSTAGGDRVDMDLKYWSGDSRTLNEVYRSRKGNIINLKQVKVDDGKTTVTTPTGIPDWGSTYNAIGPMEVNRDYRPVRKLWFNYNEDEYACKIFPLSDEYEALTSDDPLRISNNHVYWEESPWLDEYEPSTIFEPDSGTFPLKKGRWIRRLSFVTRDSSDDYPHRLTFLRGASFKALNQNYSLEATAATPMSLWDEYYRSNSVAGASRFKIPLQDNLKLGLTATTKVGLNGGSAEALNQAEAIDLRYQASPLNSVYLEVAESHTGIQEAKGFDTAYDGVAAKFGLDYDAVKEKTGGIYAGEVYLAHMDQNFYPGLSNYRYTRNDEPTFSRHIYFSAIKEEDKPLIWGDGIDRGRNVAGFRLNLKSFDEAWDANVRYRNVHRHSGKYVESALRAETTYKATEKFTSKILSYYLHLPQTRAKYDPLVYAKTMYSLTDYFSEKDIYAENSNIIDDKDPSVGAFGLGGRYDFTERVSLEGIYERTNDPLDFPRGLLNDTYVTTETRDGVVWDKVVPFLYDQKFFDLPPYHYYNIAKSRLIYAPVKEWKFIVSFTFNENKYASGINDNVNHAGLEADFMATDKLTFWFKYMHTRLIDIYKQSKYQHDDFYEGHHNIFFGSEYRFNKDESFTLLYGEFVGYNDPYEQTYWTLSALDTQHIVRLFYRRKF